jgi:TolB-like protein/Flp pilus assembly protein TadD
MQLLLFLADRAPRVVSREEVFDEVWEGRAVVDETLTRAVSLLRQALGDEAKNPRYLETIPTRGYRLIATIDHREHDSSPVQATIETSRPARRRMLSMWVVVSILVIGAAIAWVLWPEPPQLTSPVSTKRPGIAVLPFSSPNQTSDAVTFSEGLTDEIIHQLATISGFKVVSRTSSAQFAGADRSAREIADTLGVDYLLEGSVLAAGDQVRIHAQLIRPETDEHLFSRRYERPIEDVFSLQRDVARDVVQEARIRVTTDERLRLSSAKPVEPEAYRLYLGGLQAMNRRTNIHLAVTLLQRSVERDPGFAFAWAALAEASLLSVLYLPDEAGHAAAEEAIIAALELNPEIAQAHAARGLLYTSRDQNWARAEAAYRRAIELEPSYATAQQWYSEMLAVSGRTDDALDQIRIALDLDPLSPLMHAAYGHRLSTAEAYSHAERELLTAEELGAEFNWHFTELAHVRTRMGDEIGAIEARRRQMRHLSLSERDLDAFEAAVADAGMRGFWRWYLEYLEATSDRYPIRRAEALAALGEDERALQWLAKSLQSNEMWFLHTQRSPAFDGLRDDPRYLALVSDYPIWRPAE